MLPSKAGRTFVGYRTTPTHRHVTGEGKRRFLRRLRWMRRAFAAGRRVAGRDVRTEPTRPTRPANSSAGSRGPARAKVRTSSTPDGPVSPSNPGWFDVHLGTMGSAGQRTTETQHCCCDSPARCCCGSPHDSSSDCCSRSPHAGHDFSTSPGDKSIGQYRPEIHGDSTLSARQTTLGALHYLHVGIEIFRARPSAAKNNTKKAKRIREQKDKSVI